MVANLLQRVVSAPIPPGWRFAERGQSLPLSARFFNHWTGRWEELPTPIQCAQASKFYIVPSVQNPV
jgi:hypothetical protein